MTTRHEAAIGQPDVVTSASGRQLEVRPGLRSHRWGGGGPKVTQVHAAKPQQPAKIGHSRLRCSAQLGLLGKANLPPERRQHTGLSRRVRGSRAPFRQLAEGTVRQLAAVEPGNSPLAGLTLNSQLDHQGLRGLNMGGTDRPGAARNTSETAEQKHAPGIFVGRLEQHPTAGHGPTLAPAAARVEVPFVARREAEQHDQRRIGRPIGRSSERRAGQHDLTDPAIAEQRTEFHPWKHRQGFGFCRPAPKLRADLQDRSVMSPQPAWIAPSILAADFARLGAECEAVLEAGADAIHFDVMDNHYVPNLSIGPLVLQSLRKAGIDAFMDVHLMVKPVDRLIGDFLTAGADLISVHPESTEHLHRTLASIRDGGAQAGLVLNPGTPLEPLVEVLDLVDLVLVMSVNPGFGGQSFIPQSIAKLQRVRGLLDEHAADRTVRLEIDGGIKVDNIAATAAAGADTFVAGSAIFGSTDYNATIAAMRAALAGAS